MYERFDLIRLLLGSGVAGTAVYQVTKALRTVWVERSRRKTMLAVMDRLIERERQLGQPGPQLEIVRPSPDQLEPPASYLRWRERTHPWCIALLGKMVWDESTSEASVRMTIMSGKGTWVFLGKK